MTRSTLATIAITLCLPLTGLGLIRADDPPAKTGEATHRVKSVMESVVKNQDGDIDREVIEIVVTDGDARVVYNGQPLSGEQVLSDDGTVIIQTPDGESRRIRIGTAGVMFDQSINEIHGWFEESGGGGRFGTLRQMPFETTRPPVMIGVHLDPTGPAIERHLHLEPGATSIVTRVVEDSPAAKAGLAQYDLLTSINGAGPATIEQLHGTLMTMEPGQVVSLGVIQEGVARSVDIEVTESAVGVTWGAFEGTGDGWVTHRPLDENGEWRVFVEPQGHNIFEHRMLTLPDLSELHFTVEPGTVEFRELAPEIVVRSRNPQTRVRELENRLREMSELLRELRADLDDDAATDVQTLPVDD